MWDPMASLSLVSSECDQHTPCGQTMSVQSSSEDDFSGEDLSGSFEDNDRTLSSNHNTKESTKRSNVEPVALPLPGVYEKEAEPPSGTPYENIAMEALCLLKKGDTAYLRERISRDREKIKVLRTKRVLMHRKYSGKISALEHKVLRNMKTILVFHTSEAVRSDSQTSGPLSLEERRSLEHENDQIQLKLAHKYLQDLELHIAAKPQVH